VDLNHMSDPRLYGLLRFLTAEQIRATYGAVAGVVGVYGALIRRR